MLKVPDFILVQYKSTILLFSSGTLIDERCTVSPLAVLEACVLIRLSDSVCHILHVRIEKRVKAQSLYTCMF